VFRPLVLGFGLELGMVIPDACDHDALPADAGIRPRMLV
jgi:hypothetical protein